MAGITNHPEAQEDENQQRVERRKAELLHAESADESPKTSSASQPELAADVPVKSDSGRDQKHEGPKAAS
jgi:hypothetical protein